MATITLHGYPDPPEVLKFRKIKNEISELLEAQYDLVQGQGEWMTEDIFDILFKHNAISLQSAA